MRTVYGSGRQPCDLFLCGERPGWEETREDLGFVGPAGRELWEAFADEHLPARGFWWITNVVKTFSKEPPNREDINKWSPLLRQEIRKTRPKLVVTVGAHALRWFLGDDAELDKVHGLVFQRDGYVVIPTYHSSAALRQPEIYQGRFRQDVAAIRQWLDGESTVHVTKRLDLTYADLRVDPPYMLLGLGSPIGLDLEGSIHEPECLTFSDGKTNLLTGTTAKDDAVNRGLLSRHCHMHYAVRDLRALWRLGLGPASFDDSMLAAYLLGEPQGLKTLAYRLLRLDMDDYLSLIQPLDDTLVRSILESAYAAHQKDPDLHATAKKAAERRSKVHAALARRSLPAGNRSSPGRDRDPLSRRHHQSDSPRRYAPVIDPETWTGRVVSNLRRLLDKTEAKDTIRSRWQNCVAGSRVSLPPEPTWKDLKPEVGVPYACTDAYAHKAIGTGLNKRLKAEGLWDCYQMDLSVIPMLARMESVGMLADAKALRQLSTDLHLEYVKVCGQIERVLGYPLNPKAAEDVSEALFDDLDVTPTKLTKGGNFYTTGDKFLEARKGEHAVIPLIIQGRELWKLKSSYADKLPEMLDEQGRYHPEFGYTRTASGRLAETIILLIPKHSAWGKKIRKAFVAAQGNRLVSCDLSQIELRVLAHESKDKALIQVFREGRDPHAETAHRLLGAPKNKEDQDESKHRLPSKKANFGAFMGLSEGGLTEQIRAGGNPAWAVGCPACDYTGANPKERPDHAAICESRLFFKEYFKLYTGVRQFIDDRHAEARRFGFVRDMWDRKIYVPGIYSSNKGIVRRFERMAQATPIQSGADGISKHWNAAIWNRMLVPHRQQGKGWYLEPWTRTHDDTVLEVSERFASVTRDRMLKLVPQVLCIPVTAEGKIGHNWGELKAG